MLFTATLLLVFMFWRCSLFSLILVLSLLSFSFPLFSLSLCLSLTRSLSLALSLSSFYLLSLSILNACVIYGVLLQTQCNKPTYKHLQYNDNTKCNKILTHYSTHNVFVFGYHTKTRNTKHFIVLAYSKWKFFVHTYIYKIYLSWEI